jgi:hypothetical protein
MKINFKRVSFLALSVYALNQVSFKYEPILRRFSCFDPSASIKKAVSLCRVETVRVVYVRASVTNFAVLKTVMSDFTGAVGLSFTQVILIK